MKTFPPNNKKFVNLDTWRTLTRATHFSLFPMKLSTTLFPFSLLASVLAMNAKDVRKPTEEALFVSAEEIEAGAIVPFEGEEKAVVQYKSTEELVGEFWAFDDEDLEEYHYPTTGAITILSPEAIQQLSCAVNGTCDLLYYTGTQMYCISKVVLTMAHNALAATNAALDKAEEIEGGVKQVLDKGEETAVRFQKVRGEFKKDLARANDLYEGKISTDNLIEEEPKEADKKEKL